MTSSAKSSRRQLATVVMLVLALLGGLVRWLAPQPSVARDLGSLLMVLWLPIVGNIIGWLIQRAKAPRHVLQGFAPDAVFEPSARIELTLLAADTPRLRRQPASVLAAVKGKAQAPAVRWPSGTEG